MGLLRITSINKPKGWTSFDVVRFVKHYFQEKRVGHLGTLDPMATGVLPVFLGKATRLIPLFNNLDKTWVIIFDDLIIIFIGMSLTLLFCNSDIIYVISSGCIHQEKYLSYLVE